MWQALRLVYDYNYGRNFAVDSLQVQRSEISDTNFGCCLLDEGKPSRLGHDSSLRRALGITENETG